MPGYERPRIVGEKEEDLEEFSCGICLEVFIKPTVTECCGQTYCYDCISIWLSTNNTCPNDRAPLSLDILKSPPKMVTNLLSNMKIKCEFQANGCQSVIKISDLDKHLRNECLFNPDRKCEQCGLVTENKNQKVCTCKLSETFKNFYLNQIQTQTVKLENLQRTNEQLIKKQEAQQIQHNLYIKALLDRIHQLEQKEGLKGLNPIKTASAQTNGKPATNSLFSFGQNWDQRPSTNKSLKNTNILSKTNSQFSSGHSSNTTTAQTNSSDLFSKAINTRQNSSFNEIASTKSNATTSPVFGIIFDFNSGATIPTPEKQTRSQQSQPFSMPPPSLQSFNFSAQPIFTSVPNTGPPSSVPQSQFSVEEVTPIVVPDRIITKARRRWRRPNPT